MEAHDLLLVALLPKPIDLARAREGWYRIPARRAPPLLAHARALAFYQPASFGEARWQVAWWAPLRAIESCQRRDLFPEEPTHPRAADPYLVARLGPLAAVEPPKRSAKGRRLLFVPIRWAAFQSAATLDELLAQARRPIADDPLYHLIQAQLGDQGGLPDPTRPHQKRLFEAGRAYG